jgi:hypothetical protein
MAQNPPVAAGARNLGKQTQNNILDYSIKKDIKFYNTATEKLEDTCDGKNLATFLKSFGAKATQYN